MFHRTLLLVVAALCANVISTGMARAEEGTVRAFATWEADGSIVQTGPAEATLVGTVSGPVYVDTDEGPVTAGGMACAMVVHQNLKNATQQGSGQCIFKGPTGNLWFMSLNCTGVPLVGCTGDSTLTGGTGPFEKVTGGGRFAVRSNMLELATSGSAGTKDKVKGIIFWRELHYKTQ
jgi:hypothetical protein